MLSIPALGSEASVCLRCQYRIATRTPARQSHSPRTRSGAPARCLSSVRTLRQEQEIQANKQKDVPIRYTDRLPRDYVKRPLYVDALGKPAQVLIVGEPRRRETRNVHREYVDDPGTSGSASELDASKMLESIAGERGLVNTIHVQRNIEELKKDWLSHLRDESRRPTALEVEDLASTLMDGFTEKQLHTYYEQTTLQPLTFRTELDEAIATDQYQRSAWRPRVSSFPPSEADLEPVVRQQILSNPDENFQNSDLQHFASEKRNLVEKILKERWRVRSKEEEETIVGELDMYLQSEYLDILRSYNSEILTKLSERYDAKIEVSRSHHLLRLSATYDNCRDLLKLIVVILGNIRCDEMQIPFRQAGETSRDQDVPRGIFDDSLLAYVQELTNVAIQHFEPDLQSKTMKVLLYSLGKDDDDIGDVCRLITQAFRPSSSRTIQLLWTKDVLSKASAYPVDVESGLQWTERQKKWFRFGIPSTPSAQSLRGQEGPAKQHAFEHLSLAGAKMKSFLLDSGTYVQVQSQSNSPGLLWRSSSQRRLSAVLGHVLFPEVSAPSGTAEAQLAPPSPTKSDSQRSFLPNTPVPGFWPLLDKLTQKDLLNIAERKSEINTTSELWIRLVPMSMLRLAKTSDLFMPDIEICVCIDKSTNIAQLDKVNLMLSSRESDILLPDESTDLRFTDETFITAGSSFEETINKFIQASNLDIFGQDRLRTPSKAQILIPKHALFNVNRTTATEILDIPDEGLLAEYTFSSLEHRSSFSTSYEGHKLQYSIIEAGKTGGRRSEIRLVFAEPTTLTLDTLATQQDLRRGKFKQFFNAANRLVKLVGVKPLAQPTVQVRRGKHSRVRRMRLVVARRNGINIRGPYRKPGVVRKVTLDFQTSAALEKRIPDIVRKFERRYTETRKILRRVRSGKEGPEEGS